MTTPKQDPSETPHSAAAEGADAVSVMPWLPCSLTLDVSIPNFTIGDLLRLKAGSIVETEWPYVNDVPLRANGKLIGWAKFEVLGEHLATRITELI